MKHWNKGKEKTVDRMPICIGCGREITEEEAETYSGMCRECYEVEITELDFETEEELEAKGILSNAVMDMEDEEE